MSTTVPMPVRVKPPPADSGETISPGCAALAITTPENGARTTVWSRLMSLTRSCSLATWALRWATARCARRASRWAMACSYCARDTSCCRTSASRRSALASASRSCAPTLSIWLRAASAWEAYRRRCASASIGSRVAITWPASTRMPSSIITSLTRPVICAETVAMRRATT